MSTEHACTPNTWWMFILFLSQHIPSRETENSVKKVAKIQTAFSRHNELFIMNLTKQQSTELKVWWSQCDLTRQGRLSVQRQLDQIAVYGIQPDQTRCIDPDSDHTAAERLSREPLITAITESQGQIVENWKEIKRTILSNKYIRCIQKVAKALKAKICV